MMRSFAVAVSQVSERAFTEAIEISTANGVRERKTLPLTTPAHFQLHQPQIQSPGKLSRTDLQVSLFGSKQELARANKANRPIDLCHQRRRRQLFAFVCVCVSVCARALLNISILVVIVVVFHQVSTIAINKRLHLARAYTRKIRSARVALLFNERRQWRRCKCKLAVVVAADGNHTLQRSASSVPARINCVCL